MSANIISNALIPHEQQIFSQWVKKQMAGGTLRLDLLSEKDLQEQSKEFLKLFFQLIQTNEITDIDSPSFDLIRQFLKEISDSRAIQGFNPTETAIFIFSLKEILFNHLSQSLDIDKKVLAEILNLTILLDKLGLYTFEEFQRSREEVITRQQQEMLDLSTPVVKLWEGILVLPLIGTLDSARTQQVMESLLQKIVETNSTVAIIDITGIPTVDTLVAQHLIKTVNAARLMGAECVVSGIRPQIAQTIVHLGISLQEVTTKATLSDAVAFSIKKAGFSIIRSNS